MTTRGGAETETDAREDVGRLSWKEPRCFAEALTKPGEPKEGRCAAFVGYHGKKEV